MILIRSLCLFVITEICNNSRKISFYVSGLSKIKYFEAESIFIPDLRDLDYAWEPNACKRRGYETSVSIIVGESVKALHVSHSNAHRASRKR